jgi:hypothetical protein
MVCKWQSRTGPGTLSKINKMVHELYPFVNILKALISSPVKASENRHPPISDEQAAAFFT